MHGDGKVRQPNYEEKKDLHLLYLSNIGWNI